MNETIPSAETPESETPHETSDKLNTPEHRAFCVELNHKLRTPLNAILGYSELLLLHPGGGKRENSDVQQILKSAREILSIIESDLNDGSEPPAMAEAAANTCDLLYVEDDEVNFTLVERILEYRPKVKLSHAANGRTGLEMAEAFKPKLVLLDLNLPDMHGSEVMQALQQNAATAHIPVVILSANATPSAIERLLAAGAKNYLTKPFDIDPFLAVIDEFTAAPARK